MMKIILIKKIMNYFRVQFCQAVHKEDITKTIQDGAQTKNLKLKMEITQKNLFSHLVNQSQYM